MRRLAYVMLLLLVGCSSSPTKVHPQAPDSSQNQVAQQAPPSLTFWTPEASRVSPRLNRDEMQEELAQFINQPIPIEEGLETLVQQQELRIYRQDALPWVKADLDGDGELEYLLALRVTDSPHSAHSTGRGAALFVISGEPGAYQVERSDPFTPMVENRLMQPYLHGVADLMGTGTPQIIWSRPQLIATGPQPYHLFVTEWRPGSFRTLPEVMAISNPELLAIEGAELVLTGGTRQDIFLPKRTDRYRFQDGAFHLVDRRFLREAEYSYDHLWDGLVAEAVGRVEDGVSAYQMSLSPDLQPHSGRIRRYMAPPVELSPAELASVGEAVRALALFRLLLLHLDAPLLESSEPHPRLESQSYAGLLQVPQKANSRQEACEAATDWAKANPDFLTALNLGVTDAKWRADLLCEHPDLEDHPPWVVR